MSGVFGFSREAIRVKVKKCEGNMQPEWRKFSVDPEITSFEVLQSILAKAFDLKGDFTICYRLLDVSGHEVYAPLLSDWDLDAAFLKAHNVSNNSEPCLCLRIDLKSFEECSDDWELKQNVPIITQIRTSSGQEVKASPRLHGIFNQMGKTLNMVQRAFNFGEDGSATLQPPRQPLSDSEFRRFLDPVGQILYSKELRSVIYFGGIDPSLRKVVWKHILNVYPDGMTGRQRMDYIKQKATEYTELRETWKSAIAQGPVVGELAYTTGMVRKDVLRTDRHHPFYAGNDDNQNIAALFNILTTYALNHPKVSYCQGMSDIASPLLVVMNDEAHAYICFCSLMTRLSTNFMLDGIAMTQKFTHLAEGLLYYDPDFYNYLKIHQADDLLFCYRWLLLEMKREFAFDDSLRMLEVLWSSLPADPPGKELKLYDVKFQPVNISTPPISPLVKTPRENPYTKVCALRRQSSSISLHNYAGKKKTTSIKRQIHSLDETVGRNNCILDIKLKHQSLDDASLVQKLNRSADNSPKSPKSYIRSELSPRQSDVSSHELRPRSVSPLEQKSDSVILNNRINSHRLVSKSKSSGLSSSMSNLIKNTKKTGHFKELKDKLSSGKIGIFSSLDRLDRSQSIKEEGEVKPSGKMVKNLNEFLNFTATKSKGFDKLHDSNEKPKIMLTKSSFDDTDTSSATEKTRHYSSTSNSCDENDTFDECSPDDSQEYFPMTTSVTRELRLELENLDRQVFGNKYPERLLDDSPSNDLTLECSELEGVEDISKSETKSDENEIRRSRRDNVFVWENPLHQTSPGKPVANMDTQDEEQDDFASIVDESSSMKTVTPIRILNAPKPNKNTMDVTEDTTIRNVETETRQDISDMNIVALTSSCEEVTENKSSALLPPPNEFGGGNPFLMFLCITVLLQHRDHIIGNSMDYNEMAMHFDKMVRKHNVTRVLNQARQMYARYLKQHTIAQQKINARCGDC